VERDTGIRDGKIITEFPNIYKSVLGKENVWKFFKNTFFNLEILKTG